MAKNYTFSEAVSIIAKGTDLESVADIGRRYPVLATKVAVVAAKAGETFVDLMNYMPDYLTANKVNSAIKAGITPADADETEAETEDAEETKENETKTETETEAEDTKTVEWNESMSGKQLWDLLGKAGKRKVAKSTKKADLIEACKEVFGAANAEDDEPAEENTETEENATPYDGKSAVELFKECKARKLKVAPKKPAKFYVDLLVKDDADKAAAKSESEEADDDDWSDDEPAEKPAKKEEKKPAKPAKKAEAESDDEDDDWDI